MLESVIIYKKISIVAKIVKRVIRKVQNKQRIICGVEISEDKRGCVIIQSYPLDLMNKCSLFYKE